VLTSADQVRSARLRRDLGTLAAVMDRHSNSEVRDLVREFEALADVAV
jgi:hypothetical protein